MVGVVDRHNGIVNKFLGDGSSRSSAPRSRILSRRKTPSPRPWRCCRERSMEPRDTPRCSRRIGIHVGEAVTGTVGSHAARNNGHRRHGEFCLAPREPQQRRGFAAHRLRRRAPRRRGKRSVRLCPLGPSRCAATPSLSRCGASLRAERVGEAQSSLRAERSNPGSEGRATASGSPRRSAPAR